MKYLFMILMAFGAYQWYSSSSDASDGFTGEMHDELIMYSLTTCGFCKQKAKELKSADISFTEYFIDEDYERANELNGKLAKAGYTADSYGTPIFDAYGYMLPNNPSVSKIVSLKSGN